MGFWALTRVWICSEGRPAETLISIFPSRISIVTRRSRKRELLPTSCLPHLRVGTGSRGCPWMFCTSDPLVFMFARRGLFINVLLKSWLPRRVQFSSVASQISVLVSHSIICNSHAPRALPPSAWPHLCRCLLATSQHANGNLRGSSVLSQFCRLICHGSFFMSRSFRGALTSEIVQFCAPKFLAESKQISRSCFQHGR